MNKTGKAVAFCDGFFVIVELRLGLVYFASFNIRVCGFCNFVMILRNFQSFFETLSFFLFEFY